MYGNQKKTNIEITSSAELTIWSIEKTEVFWHQDIELIYVLSGSIDIQCRNIEYKLYEDDIIVVNTFDIHTISGKSAEVLSLKVNASMLDPEISKFAESRFDCNSAADINKARYVELKQLLALLVKNNINCDEDMDLINKSYIYKILYILLSNFKVEDNSSNYMNKNFEKMTNILNYINNKFVDRIIIDDLSRELYISKSYISKLFRKFLGLSFSEYLTEVRLSHAVKDLYDNSLTIGIIAEKNGFSNTRSFVSSFKKKYKCLPNSYRKTMNEESVDSVRLEESMNYFNLKQTNSFNKLTDYLKKDNFNEKRSCTIRVSEIPPINMQQRGSLLRKTFKNLICIGKAKQLLISENKHMLSEIQKDIGFKYIRFHGLLDDEMMIYSEDEKGNPRLCFTYIDIILDYLISINIKPFIELSFMPRELAKNPERTMFYIRSIISLPKDMSKWNYMILELTKHLVQRYGEEEVASWPFILWNEPDVTQMFGFKNRNDFFNFYKETYRSVKSVNSKILFGSSPVFGNTLEGANDFIDDFMEFSNKNDCCPDFISTHFYPMSLICEDSTTLSKSEHIKMNKFLVYKNSENALKETIQNIKKRIKHNKWKTNKLYLTGWNSSISNNELLNDTVYKAAYIAKNILENFDEIESFGYWQISDFSDEVEMNSQVFHGGQGLYTYNGIRKSHYYVFKMLNKLGNVLIKKGDGYFITSDGCSFQIMLYNYQHYSRLYASGELFDMDFKNRYTPFQNSNILKIILSLNNLSENKYQITETIINKKYGSSFDKWIELGGYPIESKEDIEYLKCASIPRVQKRIEYIENSSLKIVAELEPHEVRFIELRPV